MSRSSPTSDAVLVVDDEALVRMYAVDVLRDAGHTVYEAGGADEALELLEAHADIGVLFTDINMPGHLDGLDLARMAHVRHPNVHIILTSGRLRPPQESLPDDGRFLAKPYAGEAVTSLVNQLVGA